MIGSQKNWNPVAVVLSGGEGVQGATVNWTGSTGAQVLTASSKSNAAGLATTTVTAGPLAAGAMASVSACEPSSGPCAAFTINAEHAELASLLPVSGVGQNLPASGTAMPVTMEVIDGVGHPLTGATVNVYQQLTAWEPPCAGTGRCPAAQQLGSSTVTLTSDTNGLVTVTPMSGEGQAVSLQILATTGQQGSLACTITQHP